jgi:hypothetical protein
MSNKFLSIGPENIEESQAATISLGLPTANTIISTGPNGKLHPSFLPTGVGPDLLVAPATENLSAGDYVNIWDNGGTQSVRLADRSNGRQAHGFVKAAVNSGDLAEVFFEGANDALSGLTPSARYFLGTNGNPVTPGPTGPGLWQFLGIAVSATAINTDIDDAIVRI